MRREFFVVSVPVVVVRNYVVSAPGAEEAMQAVGRMSPDWFSRCMHNEKYVGFYETFEGVPMRATAMAELIDKGLDPDPDLGMLS